MLFALAMRRVRLGIGVGIALGACALVACGAARLPAPPYVMQPTAALLEADYPPPPARVELVPASPRSDAVWIDGEWTWQGSRWAWKTGRWVVAPPDASFSPWTAVRGVTGSYYVAEGKWRDRKGTEIADPPALSVAKVRGGAVTNAEGEEVPQTPNVHPDTPRDASTAAEPDGGAPLDAGAPDVESE